MNHDVFISYSRKDTDIADRICAAFDKAGISYFIDREDIDGGMEYLQILVDAIENCKVFLLLACENAYSSPITIREISYAVNKKRGEKMLLYIIDGSVLPKDVEFMFSNTNWRTLHEHPIEPVLVDDVLHLLGRKEDSTHHQVQKDSSQGHPIAKEEPHESILKVRCNVECRVFIDGEEQATAKPGNITKIPLHKGEYAVMVSGMDGLDNIEQVLTMPDRDKLLSFDLLALQKERLAKEEAKRKAKEEAERKAREEAARKAREEAARKAKEERERRAREEAERKAKEEAEQRKAREEAVLKARKETERREALEEAAQRAREESKRKEREEADRRAREEAARKTREEADRRAREAAARRAQIERDERESQKQVDNYEQIPWYKKILFILGGSAVFGLIIAAICQWEWGWDGFLGAFSAGVALTWPFIFKKYNTGCIVWIVNFILICIIAYIFHL